MLDIALRRTIVAPRCPPEVVPDPRDGWVNYQIADATMLRNLAGDAFSQDVDGWITATIQNHGDRREPFDAVEFRWPNEVDMTPATGSPPGYATQVEMVMEIESLSDHAWLGIGVRDHTSGDGTYPNGYARHIYARRDDSASVNQRLGLYASRLWQYYPGYTIIKQTANVLPAIAYGRVLPDRFDTVRGFASLDTGTAFGESSFDGSMATATEGTTMYPVMWFGSRYVLAVVKMRPWFRISRFGLPA